MNKDDILKKSQQENEGKLDERELSVLGKASTKGMQVGLLLCVALVFFSKYVLKMPEIAFAGWLVYFAMQGTCNIVTFYYLKKRSKLVLGIVEITIAIAYIVAMIVKHMV